MIAATAAAGVLAKQSELAANLPQSIRAVAFDGFAILDPRPALAQAKRLHPQAGDAFLSLFQARMFEYQWLRVLGARYKDFLSIVDDAHVFAAEQTGDRVSEEARGRLRCAFLNLKAWPDSAESLKKLKVRSLRLGLLSNMTADMLNTGLANSGLQHVFEHVLSTDAIKSYKPDPRAYQLGVNSFGLAKEQIAFVAFAGWDGAGAAWFGYPTFWVNRLGGTPERLDGEIIAIGRDLAALDQLILEHG